jgi:hypothetical protein
MALMHASSERLVKAMARVAICLRPLAIKIFKVQLDYSRIVEVGAKECAVLRLHM